MISPQYEKKDCNPMIDHFAAECKFFMQIVTEFSETEQA